jgi:ABC-2 type transport system ATP-binding protein
MDRPTALAIDGLIIRYGPAVAVDSLTLHVRRREVFGLLGPNGSGKSSTLAAVAGTLEPAGGVIRVEGISRRERPAEYARRVGVVPQEPALYEELTAAGNLAFFGGLYGLGGRELRRRVDSVLEQVGLSELARRPVQTLSGGQKQRVNLGCALLHRPAVLVLDEPTVALDAAARESLFGLLHELRDAGCAVLLTTHHLDEAERWCDRLGFLDRGRLLTRRPTPVSRLARAA